MCARSFAQRERSRMGGTQKSSAGSVHLRAGDETYYL